MYHNFQVKATDPDCGVNSIVNYTIFNDGSSGNIESKHFALDSATGRLCLSSELDYETKAYYEFAAMATDRGEFLKNYILYQNTQ